MNVPPRPLGERQTSNAVSFFELSCHVTSIRLTDAAMALVFEGPITVGPLALLAPASKEGATSWLPSQAMSESSSIGYARDTCRRASMAASLEEIGRASCRERV